jgi:hypothetical protein
MEYRAYREEKPPKCDSEHILDDMLDRNATLGMSLRQLHAFAGATERFAKSGDRHMNKYLTQHSGTREFSFQNAEMLCLTNVDSLFQC